MVLKKNSISEVTWTYAQINYLGQDNLVWIKTINPNDD